MSATEDHVKRLWIKYKNDYDYEFDKDNEVRYFHTFSENYKFIVSQNNNRNNLYKCDLNSSAHINHTEFQSILVKDAFDPTTFSVKTKIKKTKTGKHKKDLDWRIQSIVPDPKTLKYFWKKKSLWIQSILDCIESFYKLKKDTEIEFSFEQFNDKLNDVANVGMVGLTQWVLLQAQNVGFYSVDSYKTKGLDDDMTYADVYQIEGFSWIKPKVSSVKCAVACYGPAIVNIDASEKSFRFYKSGIYNSTGTAKKSAINHCALLVGYDHVIKKGTWILKNCWGKDWGNNGYINVCLENQVCDVTSNAYVVY